MAKTLKQLENKLRIKYIIRAKRYYLLFGNEHIVINGEYSNGFDSIELAEACGNKLIPTNSHIYWLLK